MEEKYMLMLTSQERTDTMRAVTEARNKELKQGKSGNTLGDVLMKLINPPELSGKKRQGYETR